MTAPGLSGFRYFSGPYEDVWFSEQGCSFCGRPRPALHTTDRHRGCLKCLRNRRFRLAHDTDLGTLENGEFLVFDHEVGRMIVSPTPAELRPEVLEELPFTPRFQSHQGCHFPLHCMDAMCYIGRWTPADFLNAQPANPRSLYLSTSGGDPHLWDNAVSEFGRTADSWPTESSTEWAWGSWCYMFRCLHCGQYSSNWDTD